MIYWLLIYANINVSNTQTCNKGGASSSSSFSCDFHPLRMDITSGKTMNMWQMFTHHPMRVNIISCKHSVCNKDSRNKIINKCHALSSISLSLSLSFSFQQVFTTIHCEWKLSVVNIQHITNVHAPSTESSRQTMTTARSRMCPILLLCNPFTIKCLLVPFKCPPPLTY